VPAALSDAKRFNSRLIARRDLYSGKEFPDYLPTTISFLVVQLSEQQLHAEMREIFLVHMLMPIVDFINFIQLF